MRRYDETQFRPPRTILCRVAGSLRAVSTDSNSLIPMPIATEDFWEDLLELIEGGNVLPVVGQGITTTAPDDALLAPWLAAKLAAIYQPTAAP